ncbi:unnamed protein product [Symbiodinium sp. KB8]|nr:unnamed protein product [Symbiodinium sp. KB8]
MATLRMQTQELREKNAGHVAAEHRLREQLQALLSEVTDLCQHSEARSRCTWRHVRVNFSHGRRLVSRALGGIFRLAGERAEQRMADEGLCTMLHAPFEQATVALGRRGSCTRDHPAHVLAGLTRLVVFAATIFADSLVEVQIAATLATASLRNFNFAKWLGKALPYSWVLSAGLVVVDCSTLAKNTIVLENGVITGAAPVVAAVMAVCFVLTLMLYLLAVVKVTNLRCSQDVIWSTSFQALLYPLNFTITVFPTWFIHKSYIKDYGRGLHHWVAAVCLDSNGWINALTYSWQRVGKHQDAFGVLPGLDVSLLQNSDAVGFEVV